MDTVTIATRSGGTTELGADGMEAFAAGLRGDVVLPGDGSYDEVRGIWNAMVDRRPGLIVRCAGTSDVMCCVKLARDHGLLVSVRGGGHNIAGNSVSDGGLMIDLSGMKSVRVDPIRRTVRAEPGVTLGDLDRETQAFGLAVPVGINSTTGIAGLTLGGGFGWLSRKHGMTIDSLVGADVVTASGEMVVANAEQNDELFWGIRGGGGNFGVVTSFEYALHEVGPEVYAGMIAHDFGDARAALDFYRDFAAGAQDDLTVWTVLRHAPPLPFLPEEHHGNMIAVFAFMFAGSLEDGEAAAAPLREFGTPLGEFVGPMPFIAFQSAFDPLLTPGARNYWKSHNFAELSDAAIDTILEFAHSLPTDESELFIAQLGGEQSRVAPGATAYWHRDANFVMNVHTRWQDSEDDDRCRGWARQLFDATAPHASGGVYVNFMPDDEPDRVEAAYGGNYDRLVALKRQYDPTNLFRLNQNISPE